MIVAGCVVPHAPILLPQLASDEIEDPALRIRRAVLSLDFPDSATVVLVSPHGRDARVSNHADGGLAGFGVRDVAVSAPVDAEAVQALADGWVWPSSSEELDHGLTVPLVMGAAKVNPVVPASLPEVSGASPAPVEKTMEEAAALSRAIEKIARERDVVVMTSANTSAGLGPRAPLTERAGAADVEERLLDALETDVGLLEDLLEDLHAVAGACGVGPLLCLARLFSGKRARLLAHESPVGVGYPVAQVVL